MHDRASTNKVAMRFVSVMYPGVVDIGCFSHTINNAGSCFKTPHLNEFLTYWLRLFSHSPKARLLWKNRTGTAVQSLSETRWWSKWEVANQLISRCFLGVLATRLSLCFKIAFQFKNAKSGEGLRPFKIPPCCTF